MKKILLSSLCILGLLFIGFFPIKKIYKDGGTETYSALLYKYISWNKIRTVDDNTTHYTGSSLILFPNNFQDLDTYWNNENEGISTTDTKTEPTKKIPPKLEVDFSIPEIKESTIGNVIQKWSQKIIDEASKSYNQADSSTQSATPFIHFTYKKYTYNNITSIVYFVEKHLYNTQPEHIIQTFHTDKDGKEISSSDLISIDDSENNITLLLKKALKKEKTVFKDDITEQIRKYLNDVHIFFNDEKLYFIFDRSSGVAPYNEGNTTVSLPIAEIRGLLNKEYFPTNTIAKEEKQETKKKVASLKHEKGEEKETNKQLQMVYHTVQEGEYVKYIADIYGIDYESIIATNHLAQPDNIEIGQKLKIPNPKTIPKQETKKKTVTNAPNIKVEEVEKRQEVKNENYTGNSGEKYIALTFDDGPVPKTTHQLLHILKNRGVKATFFVIGRNVEKFPDTVLWAYNDGHEIANHTWTHPNLSNLSDAKLQDEIQKTDAAIKKVIGKTSVLIRPPYGAFDADVKRLLSDRTILMWDVDSKDWKNRNVQKNLSTTLPNVKPGSIILFHDIHQASVDTIDSLITKLKNQGYTFVTVTELLNKGQAKSYVGKVCYGAYNCK